MPCNKPTCLQDREFIRELVDELSGASLCFRMSLLNTSADIAKEGMTFVNRWNALVERGRAQYGTEQVPQHQQERGTS